MGAFMLKPVLLPSSSLVAWAPTCWVQLRCSRVECTSAVRLTSFLLAGTHRIVVRHGHRRRAADLPHGAGRIAGHRRYQPPPLCVHGRALPLPRPVIVIDFMGAVICSSPPASA